MNGAARRAISRTLSSSARDKHVLELLGTQGSVSIADLAGELNVSEMTVRRDLDRLAEEGRLRRVRGGAIAVGPEPFARRYARRSAQKEKIADKLLALVGESGAVGMDSSTTIQRLAGRVGGSTDLAVFTNGPDTFATLQGQSGVTPILTGGQFDARTGSLVGPVARRSTHDVVLRRAFLSASALDAEFGATEQTLEDAEVKLAIVEASSSVVVAVDSSKLGTHATARCLPLSRIDVVVTDLDPTDERLDPYRDDCEIL